MTDYMQPDSYPAMPNVADEFYKRNLSILEAADWPIDRALSMARFARSRAERDEADRVFAAAVERIKAEHDQSPFSRVLDTLQASDPTEPTK